MDGDEPLGNDTDDDDTYGHGPDNDNGDPYGTVDPYGNGTDDVSML